MTEQTEQSVHTSKVIEDKPKAIKKFRISCQRVLLTYKTHLDKDAFRKWASEKLGADEVHIAHETGSNAGDSSESEEDDDPEIATIKPGGYPHTHVILEWRKVYATRDERHFDWKPRKTKTCSGEAIHPHIKSIRSREQLANTYRYLCKEDKSCEYLLTKSTSAFCTRVWSCKSLSDAVATCERPSDVPGTIAAYSARPRPKPEPRLIQEMRPWQADLMKRLSEPPDDRHILWVTDPVGGGGKSRFARHIVDSGMGQCFTGTVAMRDVAHVLRKKLDEGAPLGIIILDLTRSFRDRDVYNLIECLKNGMLLCGKYDSESIEWTPGHLIIFANFPPEKGRISQDRVILIELSKTDEKFIDDAM